MFGYMIWVLEWIGGRNCKGLTNNCITKMILRRIGFIKQSSRFREALKYC